MSKIGNVYQTARSGPTLPLEIKKMMIANGQIVIRQEKINQIA
jgi:hypothetical protein